MAAADLAAWRKQNSDPMTVDMVMTDSSIMRAVVMIPKGKTLKDIFNVEDTFLEVECLERGQMVFHRRHVPPRRQRTASRRPDGKAREGCRKARRTHGPEGS